MAVQIANGTDRTHHHVPLHLEVCSAESCHGLHVLYVADFFGGQQDSWSSHVALANEM